MTIGEYGQDIESAENFFRRRERDIVQMAGDSGLQSRALELQVAATVHRYGYQQVWCGVPVIRLPDDIMLLQEIVFSLKPQAIIETGVARGGSLLLNASLMEISGIRPNVLGIDIQILNHAREAIDGSRYSRYIDLVEGDSTSRIAQTAIQRHLEVTSSEKPALLILDSNHTHEHVSKELEILTPYLPLGSIVIVADTLIEDMPERLYENRPWGVGNNPLTAVRSFLAKNSNYELHKQWARRGLISELRDGILIKVA